MKAALWLCSISATNSTTSFSDKFPVAAPDTFPQPHLALLFHPFARVDSSVQLEGLQGKPGYTQNLTIDPKSPW